VEKKFLIIMDKDHPVTFNYEIIHTDADPQFVDIMTKFIGKEVRIIRNKQQFSYKIGKKEYTGRTVPIYEKDGKYFMESAGKYTEFSV